MESLYLLVPLSVVIVLLAGWVFWVALGSGQFDDLERPARDLLEDDDRARPRPNSGPVDLGQTRPKSRP